MKLTYREKIEEKVWRSKPTIKKTHSKLKWVDYL